MPSCKLIYSILYAALVYFYQKRFVSTRETLQHQLQ